MPSGAESEWPGKRSPALSAERPYDVLISAIAEEDLVRIAAWYAERHPAGTERFFRDFQRLRNVLAMFPAAGRDRSELRAQLRSFGVHPYLVFYRIDEQVRNVNIVRILHGRMDFDTDDIE